MVVQVLASAMVSALRAVLHAVRDRLTVGETAQMGVQLPMLVCQAMDITGV